MFSRVTLIMLSILIGACSTSLKNVKHDHTLKIGEGILLTKLQTNYPFQLALKNSSGKIFWLEPKLQDDKNVLLVMSLMGGKYTVHNISWKNNSAVLSEKETFSFSIKPGKVNYICDFGAYFKFKSKGTVEDDLVPELELVLPVYLKSSTLKEFKARYSTMWKKYPSISSPASQCIRGDSKKALHLKKLLNL